mgnify:CR=1 FL=1
MTGALPSEPTELVERRGTVWWDDRRAGTIEELADGTCRFVYDAGWLSDPQAQPISLALPLSAAAVETRGLHPFFDGLIPEGWLLDIATRNWKLDPRDRMGLLLSTCSDCVGAVRVTPETAP